MADLNSKNEIKQKFSDRLKLLKDDAKDFKKVQKNELEELEEKIAKQISGAFKIVDITDEIKTDHVVGLALLLKDKYKSANIDLNLIESDQERNSAFKEKSLADIFLKDLAEKGRSFRETRKKPGRPAKTRNTNTTGAAA